MNVWHVYARYYNFGDYALGIGLRNLFTRYFDPELLFKVFDVHTLHFDERVLDNLNASADLLLVGGGGLIHGFAGDKWMFRMPEELVPKMKVPCIVYGLGYNQFRGEGDIHPRIIENLKLLSRKCLSFSVRNDGSKEEMQRLGIDVPEVPDPGFFVDDDYPRPSIDGEYVLIQLANDMKHARGFDETALLSNMERVVRYLMQRGYKIVLCPHVRDDDGLGRRLIERMGNPAGVFSWNWFEIIRDEYNFKGLSYYKHAKIVIGMRGHAQICSAGMLTPVITVGNHRKHFGLIKKLQLPEHYVEANDPQLAEKMITMIDDIEANFDFIKMKYKNSLEEMTDLSAVFIKKLAEKYRDRGKNGA